MLRLYDTRRRQVEPVAAPGTRLLRMYSCGPIVYRQAHLADLRSYLLPDLIRRISERQSMRLIVCQGITDVGHLVDDAESARVYEDAFRRDALALNFRTPEHTPRASESIDVIIELIARLIKKGHAYVAPDGSVFFAADSPMTPDPRDWALWKSKTPGKTPAATTWDAPWGSGFPGRHIGCSAMSLNLLGEHIDIHTGGMDLRSPHHESERAQSDEAVGHEVVERWAHSERLLFDEREIAESTGNVVLLSDVEAAGLDPLAVRLAFMEHHYRRQMNLTWDTLREADRTLRTWRRRVAEWAESPSRPIAREHADHIQQAFEDDLDTPLVLRLLHELERDESTPPGARFETFLHFDHLLGLDLSVDIGRVGAPDDQVWDLHQGL